MDLEELVYLMEESKEEYGITYSYHITEYGNGSGIIENGLAIQQGDLKSSTLKLPKAFYTDVRSFIEEERNSNKGFSRDEMVLIATSPKDSKRYTNIKVEYSPEHLEEHALTIPPRVILGYIDMHSEEFVGNPEFEYIDVNTLGL